MSQGPPELAWIAASVFFAFVVRGISGFGAGMIAVPLLAFVVPLQVAVPLNSLLVFVLFIAMMIRDRSRIEADLARNQQNPGIDVTVFGARQFGPEMDKRFDPVVGTSVLLDIPILNRVNEGRERSAEAAIAKAEDQKRFARDRIVADVRNALVTMDASRQRAAMAQREVKVATELAKAELRRFELGDGNLLLVNLREQANAEAAIREIDALADLQRAVANFRAATARDVRD